MPDAAPPRPDGASPPDRPARRRRPRGGAVAVGLLVAALAVGGALVWGGAPGLAGGDPTSEVAAALQTPGDLLAWVRTHPGASLVVWDVESDSAVVAVRPDAQRPVAGLTGLLLAAELSRRAGRGLDTASVLPASAVEQWRLPGAEDGRGGRAASLADLARRALGADGAAADALLWTLGRGATDALPARLGLGVEAPLPIGGLLLSWAPAGRPGPRDSLAAAFVALGRPAQRDSAFARSLAYVESPSVRAAERARLEQEGLGLTPDAQRTAARATFPRGTARAYARLLARAVRGDLLDPETSARFLRLVSHTAPDSLRGRGGRRLGVVGGEISGLVGRAGVLQAGRGGRVAVLLLEGAPSAVLDHLAQTGLGERLVVDLLAGEAVGERPGGGAGGV